jgi:micrococcal nuclease
MLSNAMKNCRNNRLLALSPLIFAVALLFSCVEKTAGAEECGDVLQVYVTPSGSRYHRENCSTLSHSSAISAVSLAEAAGSGREPCGVCNPPVLPGATSADPATGDAGLYRVNLPLTGGGALSQSSRADISRMVPALVSRHTDGDTVRVTIANPPPGIAGAETIRMIGVDTPETVHPSRPVERFGKEASDYTKSRLLGKPVLLAFDWDIRDRYGRLLCYIYTEEGCYNAELIREGYAHAYTRFAFQFMDEFRALEQEARTARRGLWGE